MLRIFKICANNKNSIHLGGLLHGINWAEGFKEGVYRSAGQNSAADEYQKRHENSPAQGGKPDYSAARGFFHRQISRVNVPKIRKVGGGGAKIH